MVGIPLIALFDVIPDNVDVMVSALNLINEDGVLLQSINNITSLGANRYGAAFLPPSETFQLQVSGIDENGYNFLRTSDTSVRVTSVNLIISMYIIYVCNMHSCNMLHRFARECVSFVHVWM